MVGHGGSSAGSYLADPTSPIPSHCASIVATSTVRVKTVVNICWHTSRSSLQTANDSGRIYISHGQIVHWKAWAHIVDCNKDLQQLFITLSINFYYMFTIYLLYMFDLLSKISTKQGVFKWFVLFLCCLMTSCFSKDMQCHVWPYFFELVNHQIRHQGTHKVGCQLGDCIGLL